MIPQIKITFYHYFYKKNARGEAPIYCRLSLSTQKQQFSTGINILPELWDKESQRVRGTNDVAMLANRKLQEIYTQFIRLEKQLYDEGEEITLEAIYSRYRGKIIEHTLCTIFEERMAKMRSLVDVEYSLSTLKKFREVYQHIQGYLTSIGQKDINVKCLNFKFIKGYEEYLLGKQLRPITINKIIQRLRQMVLYAVRCGYITHDPFAEYKPLKERKQLVFLTAEELQKLEKHQFEESRLERVKELFLFSVYTGLAYNEAHTLQEEHISKGFDGRRWITLTRKKTDREVSIPILPKAEALLAKIVDRNPDSGNYLLPQISNQKINVYLKEIAKVLKINKKLTHHTARKTFASTILLYNDVPIEVVSALLGHSDIAVTQRSYAQVVNRNISRHMDRVLEKLK